MILGLCHYRFVIRRGEVARLCPRKPLFSPPLVAFVLSCPISLVAWCRLPGTVRFRHPYRPSWCHTLVPGWSRNIHIVRVGVGGLEEGWGRRFTTWSSWHAAAFWPTEPDAAQADEQHEEKEDSKVCQPLHASGRQEYFVCWDKTGNSKVWRVNTSCVLVYQVVTSLGRQF